MERPHDQDRALPEGRRWRVLAAKAASLWIVAIAIVVVDWVVLGRLQPDPQGRLPAWQPEPVLVGGVVGRRRRRRPRPAGHRRLHLLGIAAAVIVRNALGGSRSRLASSSPRSSAAGNFAAVAPWTLT